MLSRILFPFVLSLFYLIYINAEECRSILEKDLHVLIQKMEAMETKMKQMERREIAVSQRETAMLRRIWYLEIKLNQVEKRTTDYTQRLEKQQTEIQQLQSDLYNQLEKQRKMDSFFSTGSVKTNLVSDIYEEETIKSSVNEQNVTKMTKRENMISYYSGRSANGTVAFSAYLSNFVYHLGVEQVVKYDGILTNEGLAYNPITGIFTCPWDGLYLIAFFTGTVSEHKAWVKLVVDGITVSNAVSEGTRGGHDDQGGNVAILRLRAGQSVWTAILRQGNAELDSTSDYRHVTFSGVRLSD